MFRKLQITGTITVETGMHIGGSDAFAAIGAIDSPIMKDPLSDNPILPGSSLKGKMRTLLAKMYNEENVARNPSEDDEKIRKLFGDSKSEEYKMGRLIFRDAVMTNADNLKRRGAKTKTEVKFENTIDRISAIANPRQIERAMRGSTFPLDIVYESKINDSVDDIEDDFEVIANGLKLLQYDYLGGHGSRGYGKIKISDVKVNIAFGELDNSHLDRIGECIRSALS